MKNKNKIHLKFGKKSSDISVHINADDYGISEDSHHILMHILLQHTINLINKS